jgi:hypothetical protein
MNSPEENYIIEKTDLSSPMISRRIFGRQIGLSCRKGLQKSLAVEEMVEGSFGRSPLC